MPYRPPVPLLTEAQRQAIRDRFCVGKQWEREAAKSFGLDAALRACPLPRGWEWSGPIGFNAQYDFVEATISRGTREVDVVCTAAEARDPVKVWGILHTAIHGPCAEVWGRRRYPKLPAFPLKVGKCPPRPEEAEVVGGVPPEDSAPALATPE